MIQSFDVSKAAFHFASVGRRPWVTFLTYAGILLAYSLVLTGGFVALFLGVGGFAVLEAVVTETWNDELIGFALAFGAASILAVIISAALWAVMETAALRYFFEQRFALGFGVQELRTLIIGLLWTLIGFVILGAYVLFTIGLLSVTGAGPDFAQISFASLLLLPFLAFLLIVSVRYSPASALTYSEGRVLFTSARQATRGRAWSLLGAFVIILAIVFAVAIAVETVFQIAFVGVMALNLEAFAGFEGTNDPDEAADIAISVLTNPLILISLVTYYVFRGVVTAAQTWAFLGANALAVKTKDDPRIDPLASDGAPTPLT